jgi:nitrate reductase gamma subunit
MDWFHYLSISAALYLVLSILFTIIKLVRQGVSTDYSTAIGNAKSGVVYSLTSAMSPRKKESAFLHKTTYGAGIGFHIGTFLAIVLYFLSWSNVVFPDPLRFIFMIILSCGIFCGISVLVKRITTQTLRKLSNPDDYFANIIVTLFQVATIVMFSFPGMDMYYFVIAALLMFYFPAGKLMHAVFFFSARYHLGVFFGRRGVWPSKPLH